MFLSNIIKECQSKFNICVDDIRLTVGEVLTATKLLLNDPIVNMSVHWTDKQLIGAVNVAVREIRRRRYDARTDFVGRYIQMKEINSTSFNSDDLIALNGDFLAVLSNYCCYVLCMSEGHGSKRLSQAEKFLGEFSTQITKTPLFVGINRFASWANSAVREVRRRYPETLIDEYGKFVVFDEISATGNYGYVVIDENDSGSITDNNGIIDPEDILIWDKELRPTLYFKNIAAQSGAEISFAVFDDEDLTVVADALAIINVKDYQDHKKFALEPTSKSKICGEIKFYQQPTTKSKWQIKAYEKELLIDNDKFQDEIVNYMLYAASLEINNQDLADFYLKLFNRKEGK